jgi:hypothetical protein
VGQEAGQVPRWFGVAQRAFLILYGLVAAGCMAAAFLLMAIGAVVYRDFSSYRLYGSPWEPSSFPWYTIWSMRMMSIVALQFAVALSFGFLFIVIAAVWPARLGSPLTKRLMIGALAILIQFAAAAWFGRWFG